MHRLPSTYYNVTKVKLTLLTVQRKILTLSFESVCWLFSPFYISIQRLKPIKTIINNTWKYPLWFQTSRKHHTVKAQKGAGSICSNDGPMWTLSVATCSTDRLTDVISMSTDLFTCSLCIYCWPPKMQNTMCWWVSVMGLLQADMIWKENHFQAHVVEKLWLTLCNNWLHLKIYWYFLCTSLLILCSSINLLEMKLQLKP